MGSESKVFVCVVFHHSDMRPQGLQMAKNFCNSWKRSGLNYRLVVLDNESTCGYNCLDGIEHDFIRVVDQIQIGGCTGAWNILCNYAYMQGAKVITGFADDVQVNPSLKYLVDAVKDDNAVYVPLTDGVNPPFTEQIANEPIKGLVKDLNIINGFWMAFSSNFWHNKKDDNQKLFIPFRDSDTFYMDEWAGQELMFHKWKKKYNTKGYLIGDCWLHHTKLRSWKIAREIYNYDI